MIVKNCLKHNNGTPPPIVLQDANHGTVGAGVNTVLGLCLSIILHIPSLEDLQI